MSTDRRELSEQAEIPLTATIVVATYNRPRELDRLIAGLGHQQRPPLQVIVVDDGSEQPARPRFPVDDGIEWLLIRQANAGPGGARDRGIDAARGDVIIVVDDDMIVTDRFVAAHLDVHERGVDVVQGRFDLPPDENHRLFDRVIMSQQQSYFDRCAFDPSQIDPSRLATGNVSFRRQLYREVGGFDLTLKRREDSDLGLRFAAAGARFGHNNERTAVHAEPAESLGQWLRVARQYGVAAVDIDRRHPGVCSPWTVLDQLPAAARVWISAFVSRPHLLWMSATTWAILARVCEGFRLRSMSERLYAAAYACSWFTGTVGELGATQAKASLARHRSEQAVGCRVLFGGVGVDVVGEDEAVRRILDLSSSGDLEVVVTPNVDHIVLYGQDDKFASTYDRANLVLADGMPLVAVSRLLRLPLRQKVSGSDLLEPLAAAAAHRGVRIYLLGATDSTTAEVERRWSEEHPGIEVVGRCSPRYDDELGGRNDEVAAALVDVRETGAQLVLLAFGAPKQEQLLATYLNRLPPACYVCCGASLDFVAGKISRAPQWVSRWGLEWAYRLMKEPRRLWRRYLLRDVRVMPIFLAMAIKRISGGALVVRAGPSGREDTVR